MIERDHSCAGLGRQILPQSFLSDLEGALNRILLGGVVCQADIEKLKLSHDLCQILSFSIPGINT